MSLYDGTANAPPSGAADRSPSPPRPARRSCARSCTACSMSASACRVKSGIVAFDSAIRWTIWTWVREGCRVVTTPLAPRAGSCLATAPRSAFTIRPPGPEPVSPRRSICDSRAMRRASGDSLTRSVPLPASDAWPAAAGAAARPDSAGTGDPGTGSDLPPILAITPLVGTVCPSPARIRSVPSASASNVTVALSVSTSASGSPFDTRSPSCLSQRTIVPSSIESDNRGITTSGMSAHRPTAIPARSRTAAAIAPAPGMKASSSCSSTIPDCKRLLQSCATLSS